MISGLRIRESLVVEDLIREAQTLHHARMYEAENRLVAELRAVDRAKPDFLATVSHELRTPREGQGTTVTIGIPLLAAGDPRILLPEVPVAGGGRRG